MPIGSQFRVWPDQRCGLACCPFVQLVTPRQHLTILPMVQFYRGYETDSTMVSAP